MVVEKQYKHKETGKNVIVALNDFGYRCGYVEVKHPNVVPVYNRLYHKNIIPELDFNVFGGVTWNGFHAVVGSTVIGFDCHHFGSLPDIEAYKKHYQGNKELEKAIKNENRRNKGKVWTVDDVSKECEKLAIQIACVEDSYNIQRRIAKRNKWKHKGWK